MIGYYEIKIIDKKLKTVVATVQIVGGEKEAMESDDFEKRKAVRAAGYDPKLDKWNIEKFKFEATLLKRMDTELGITKNQI